MFRLGRRETMDSTDVDALEVLQMYRHPAWCDDLTGASLTLQQAENRAGNYDSKF